VRDQRVEIAMMRTPDSHSRLELSRFLTTTSGGRNDFSSGSPKSSAER